MCYSGVCFKLVLDTVEMYMNVYAYRYLVFRSITPGHGKEKDKPSYYYYR